MIDKDPRFLNIIDSSDIVLFVLDKNGIISFSAGKGLKKSPHYNQNRIGKSIFEIFPEEKELLDTINTVLSGKDQDPSISVNFAGRRYEGHFSLLYDEAGNIDGLVAIAVDVTDRRKQEDEFKEMKVNFVSMVSHEFRTPLAAILTSTHIVQKHFNKLTDAERNENLDKIKKSVSVLTSLIEDVSNFNKLQNHKPIQRTKEFDAAYFLKSIIDEESLSYKKLPQIEYVGAETLTVNTDELLLRQIFSNIVSNSIKYTPIEKSIIIDLQSKSEQLIFTVKDTGIGISEEIRETLFESFVRGLNTTGKKGTGLGLTIVKRAVDILKGEIEFVSSVENGTSFIIKINNIVI